MSGAPVVVLLLAVIALPVTYALRAARGVVRRGLRDRAGTVGELLTSLVAVVAALRLVPWQVVPPPLWALPVAATAFGALASALAWRRLPLVAGRHPRWRLAGTAVGCCVALGLLALMLLG